MGLAKKSVQKVKKVTASQKGLTKILSKVRQLLGGRKISLKRKTNKLSSEVLKRTRQFAQKIGQMLKNR